MSPNVLERYKPVAIPFSGRNRDDFNSELEMYKAAADLGIKLERHGLWVTSTILSNLYHGRPSWKSPVSCTLERTDDKGKPLLTLHYTDQGAPKDGAGIINRFKQTTAWEHLVDVSKDVYPNYLQNDDRFVTDLLSDKMRIHPNFGTDIEEWRNKELHCQIVLKVVNLLGGQAEMRSDDVRWKNKPNNGYDTSRWWIDSVENNLPMKKGTEWTISWHPRPHR